MTRSDQISHPIVKKRKPHLPPPSRRLQVHSGSCKQRLQQLTGISIPTYDRKDKRVALHAQLEALPDQLASAEHPPPTAAHRAPETRGAGWPKSPPEASNGCEAGLLNAGLLEASTAEEHKPPSMQGMLAGDMLAKETPPTATHEQPVLSRVGACAEQDHRSLSGGEGGVRVGGRGGHQVDAKSEHFSSLVPRTHAELVARIGKCFG